MHVSSNYEFCLNGGDLSNIDVPTLVAINPKLIQLKLFRFPLPWRPSTTAAMTTLCPEHGTPRCEPRRSQCIRLLFWTRVRRIQWLMIEDQRFLSTPKTSMYFQTIVGMVAIYCNAFQNNNLVQKTPVQRLTFPPNILNVWLKLKVSIGSGTTNTIGNHRK